MIGRLLRLVTGARAPVEPSVRPESEEARIADKVRRMRADESASYWCRACARTVHHPQCPLCRGKAWKRDLSGGAA